MAKANEQYLEVIMSVTEDTEVPLSVDEEEVIELSIDSSGGGTGNYLELINKPKINGVELVTNIDEIDPTVPQYVKDGKAINEDNELSFTDIKNIWDSVFKQGV